MSPKGDISKRSQDDYTVAIVCALEKELTAVRGMLDREHPRLSLSTSSGDSNIYTFGEIHGHNVVIACLPGQQGKGAAAIVATNLSRTFRSIRWRFLVGIGGGVPSAKNDVRLGDVVVSMPEGTHGGVVQYDLGKDTEAGFTLKSFLHPPPALLRSAVVNMQSDHHFKNSKVSGYLGTMLRKHSRLSYYARPTAADNHVFPKKRQSDSPEIHYGLIASGDAVIKREARREELLRSLGDVLCVEMEAAGLMTNFECIVIRGISDYADAQKNDDWHCYAAAAAAACAKELLAYVTAPEATSTAGTSASGGATNDQAHKNNQLMMNGENGHQGRGNNSVIHGNGMINSGSGSFSVGNVSF